MGRSLTCYVAALVRRLMSSYRHLIVLCHCVLRMTMYNYSVLCEVNIPSLVKCQLSLSSIVNHIRQASIILDICPPRSNQQRIWTEQRRHLTVGSRRWWDVGKKWGSVLMFNHNKWLFLIGVAQKQDLSFRRSLLSLEQSTPLTLTDVYIVDFIFYAYY